jgi:hypothetical protein
MGVSREEERRSWGAIGWMKSIVEWRDGGAADALGEADSRESGKSRNKFLSPLRTF